MSQTEMTEQRKTKTSLGKFFLVTLAIIGFLLLVGVSFIKIYGWPFEGGFYKSDSESMEINSTWFDTHVSEKYGAYLTDKEGYTLYTLDESKCDMACMKDWQMYQEIKPLETVENPVVEAEGGIMIPTALSFEPITWNKRQLYKYRGDEKAEDVNGIKDTISSLVKPE
jgi:predicted lipoprotein with Yx(FWY)xxD motif